MRRHMQGANTFRKTLYNFVWLHLRVEAALEKCVVELTFFAPDHDAVVESVRYKHSVIGRDRHRPQPCRILTCVYAKS